MAGLLLTLVAISDALSAEHPLRLRKGDHVCIIGNTLAERFQHDGWLETEFHARFPHHELTIRNLGYSADEITTRLRSAGFGTLDDHLHRLKADVVLAFFGYNESFSGEEGIPAFRASLDKFVKHLRSQSFNGRTPPRVVLFTPIAHENLGDPHLPSGKADNQRLSRFAAAMLRIAEENQTPAVDLFLPTLDAYRRNDRPLTINGIHLNDAGNRFVARIVTRSLFPTTPASSLSKQRRESLRTAVLDKNRHWFLRYRAVDGYSIFGGRSWLRFEGGFTNREIMRRELEVLDAMVARRDRAIWAAARGRSHVVDHDPLPTIPSVPTNLPGDGPNKSHSFLSGEGAVERMKIADGLRVNLFASEEQFPELANPVQMAFDTDGRLWVAVMPSYPHWRPGEKLDDKILILEDVDGDGQADRCTTFADGLHVPTGLEFTPRGLVVATPPDVLLLRDVDGDDKVDVRQRLLHGFDSADTHHALNSFVLGPGGDLYFQEGAFHHTQVETPWGPPIRNVNAGVYRFEPRRQKLEVHVAYGFANPHGHAFDRWGQGFVADATANLNYFTTPVSGRVEYPRRHHRYFPFFETRIRPAAANAILSSRQFPERMQGNYLVANVIGFQGILQFRVSEDGSGFRAESAEPLLRSSDPNFRPVDLEFGDDGSLFVLDWHNPLIGHQQHHIRDPNRDRSHGRIYRIFGKEPLDSRRPSIADRDLKELVTLLESEEDAVRYRAKIELGRRPTEAVLAELRSWTANLDASDRHHEHHLLEALWVHQYHDVVNRSLLNRLLRSRDYRARAAAVRVLSVWRDRVEEPLAKLRKAAGDSAPRVRLEAVRACSFFASSRSAAAALHALQHPTDRFLDYALQETIDALRPHWLAELKQGRLPIDEPAEAVEYLLGQIPTSDLAQLPPNRRLLEELLVRRDALPAMKREAARTLARQAQSDEATELLNAIERLSRDDSNDVTLTIRELTALLCQLPQESLLKQRARLERFADNAKRDALRQTGFLALLSAGLSIEQVWALGSRSLERLIAMVDAAQLVEDPQLRAAVHPRLLPLLDGPPDSLAGEAVLNPTQALRLRRAAILAAASTGVDREATAAELLRLLEQPVLFDAVTRALADIPGASWPPDGIPLLAERLLSHLESLPVAQRTSDSARQAFDLADRVATRLPRNRVSQFRKRLEELSVRVIVVRSVPRSMRFDRRDLYLEAGKPVELVFENVDVMPHNLVIARPNSLSEVGRAADELVADSRAFAWSFVPETDDVLLATDLVPSGKSQRLQFVAPREVGRYPFVCTFPGHWRRMNGTLHVVANLKNLPREVVSPTVANQVKNRPFVRNWTVRDFDADSLADVSRRPLARGRGLFDTLACSQCHFPNPNGLRVGPDLKTLPERLASNAIDHLSLLTEIIDPSAKIEPRYATRVVRDNQGRVVSGIVITRNDKSLKLLPNPLDRRAAIDVDPEAIEEEYASKVSLMPAGLLSSLTREEILDLLAYVASGPQPEMQDGAEDADGAPIR